MYQKSTATDANNASDAATYWFVLYWCMILLVV